MYFCNFSAIKKIKIKCKQFAYARIYIFNSLFLYCSVFFLSFHFVQQIASVSSAYHPSLLAWDNTLVHNSQYSVYDAFFTLFSFRFNVSIKYALLLSFFLILFFSFAPVFLSSSSSSHDLVASLGNNERIDYINWMTFSQEQEHNNTFIILFSYVGA